jgi:KilA-N domain
MRCRNHSSRIRNLLMSKILTFRRPVNGIPVEQRRADGFINGTAMCVAHEKDVSYWFANKSTFELLNALARRLGQLTFDFDEVKHRNSGVLSITRLSALFPNLIVLKRGAPATGGGTWIHHKLAPHLAQWCSAEFALQVSDWVEEWLLTAQNPIQSNIDRQLKAWEERHSIRIDLKDIRRVELVDVVKVWAKDHNQSPITLCSGVHDLINQRIQGARSKQIKILGGLPLGALIRDYFDASPLTEYGAISRLAKNAILDRDLPPMQAVHEACDYYLGRTYVPKLACITENVYMQGKRLQAIKQQQRLKAGIQLSLLDGFAS